MPKAVAMSLSLPGAPGVEVSINYNDSNRRVTSADWTIAQGGVVARIRVWNSGALLYDRTVAGPATGSQTVPGNVRLVEVTEGGETFLDLPPEITYQINLETIG
jgi:hypothetical protein